MSHLNQELAKPRVDARSFGLRIESRLLQVAIATPLEDGRYRLEIDDIQCPSESGWMTTEGASQLRDALSTLVERHDMKRHRVAVSLDGDFCVTRVAMGTTDEVNEELAMLADRVPRYLQLGPGEKVTGSSRVRLDQGVDYAVTGVVNRSLIQMLYDALRSVDIQIPWVEPSLVSVARLVGEARIGNDNPIMIADGTGQQWDVGITCSGRLLLDYRPAAATNEEALREALDGHISRLRRFCHRHRGIAAGDLNQLLLCGSGEKLDRAVNALEDSLGIKPTVLEVPNLTERYEIDPQARDARCVPAVATVLPLLIGVAEDDVPDLLTEVRRAPDLRWHAQFFKCGWPAIVAALVLCISYGLVSGQRHRAQVSAEDRARIEAALAATQARFTALSGDREYVDYLRGIAETTEEPNWNRLLGRITQTLPDVARLNVFRIEAGGVIHLDGTVLDQPEVYQLLENLRRLPGVSQVALMGTSPDDQTEGTRFGIRLMTSSPASTELGARHE